MVGQSREDDHENKPADQRILSKDAKLIFSWVLVNSIPIGYMNVVPLIYLVNVGYNPSLIGTIYALGAIANTIGYIPFGMLADRYGRKVFIIVGGFLPFFSYAIFGLTLNPTWLIFASILGGIGLAGGLGVAINSTALLALLTNTTTDKNRTFVFGVLQGSWISAVTIGSLLSFLPSILMSAFSLDSYTAHSYSYFIMSAFVAASTVIMLFVKEKRTDRSFVPLQTSSSKMSSRISNRLQIVSGKKILYFCILFAFVGLALGVIVQLIPTWYTLRFGTSETTAGLWIALAEFCGIFAIPLIPKLVKRGGTVFSSAATMIVSSIFLALMPLAGSFEVAAIFFVIRAMLTTVSWPILQSYMMGIVLERERATVTGITYTAWALMSSVGTFLGGALLGEGQLTLPFLIGVFGYITSSLLLFLFFRKIKPPEELELDLGSAEIRSG
jgi:MFS family permease